MDPFRTYDSGHSYKKCSSLSDEIFRQASAGFILVSVDIVLFCDVGVFLAKRSIQPAKGLWWVIGGRIRPFESITDAALRHLKTDTSLSPFPSELIHLPLRNCRHFWPLREQEPQELGVDCIVPEVLALKITKDQVDEINIHLNGGEYDSANGLHLFNWEEALILDVHQYIRDIIHSVRTHSSSPAR